MIVALTWSSRRHALVVEQRHQLRFLVKSLSELLVPEVSKLRAPGWRPGSCLALRLQRQAPEAKVDVDLVGGS